MSGLISSDVQGDLAASARLQEHVEVNGEVISADAIHREMQYHPADSMATARENAARALVIRALLLQQADALGIEAGKREKETDEEARIRRLIELQVETPEPDRESCRRFFHKNRQDFRLPDVYQVSHILLAAAPDDDRARDRAERQARELAALLADEPGRFAELAGRFSACSSRDNGGSLGRITRGQTVPEFEEALARMTPGTIRRTPLPSRFGYHLIHLEERENGAAMNFEQALPLVRDYLRESVFRRSLTQFIQVLAGKATIKGVDLHGAETPMVQ